MPAPSQPYQPYGSLHDHPQGPGDKRPTWEKILRDLELHDNQLAGKVFFITGCSGGLGLETARALHETGVDIFMTARKSKEGPTKEAIETIRSNSHGKGRLKMIMMDLASLTSVRAGVETFLELSSTLNGLILNAGIMMCPKGTTEDGFETHMGTNHFGHFLLFKLLQDTLLASATKEHASRVVLVSSNGHYNSGIRFNDMNWENDAYQPLPAYGQSKTANIYMASSIERHFGRKNLHATSVHPGGIYETGIARYQTEESIGDDFDWDSLRTLLKSTAQGAATTVWAAVAPHFNDNGGVYLADVGECGPAVKGANQAAAGYVEHTYDEVAEERFWALSHELLKLEQ